MSGKQAGTTELSLGVEGLEWAVSTALNELTSAASWHWSWSMASVARLAAPGAQLTDLVNYKAASRYSNASRRSAR